MAGLSGIWGGLEKPVRTKPLTAERIEPRRNSLLPPIQQKSEELKEKAEESETSGYLSDSPQHECDSSTDDRSSNWSAKRENYWGEQKTQKNLRNEYRVRGTPDSLSSTPDDRMKWGDRGVGVGHLWEPVVEMPESRLPQVFEAYRATPKWVERGLKLSDGNKAEILVIQHDEDERPHSSFILGQNVPVPPEILEERERKRKKALEHQNAIIKQLEERERKRKEEKENRLREERLEEERIAKEREMERLCQEEERRRAQEKEYIEQKKEEAMKEALEAAERKAKEERRKIKKREDLEDIQKTGNDIAVSKPLRREKAKNSSPATPRTDSVAEEQHLTVEVSKQTRDSGCQAEGEMSRSMTDSSSQSEGISGLQFLNMGNVPEGGLALVLDSGPPGSLLVPQDTVQLLLMSPGQPTAPAPPVQREERILTPSMLRGSKMLSDATTQTDGKCCSLSLNSVRSRRCVRLSGRASGRSDSSDKSTSLERLHSHSHCMSSSYKHRSRSQPRLNLGERPKWGINRPSVQYMKQSEKDPHYLRRLKRKSRRGKEVATSTTEEKLLESEFRLLSFQTDEEIDKRAEEEEERILKNGFRMVSNPTSPRFVPLNGKPVCDYDDFEVLVIADNGSDDVDVESKEEKQDETNSDHQNKGDEQISMEISKNSESSKSECVSPLDCQSPDSKEDGGSSSGVESLEINVTSSEAAAEPSSAPNTGRSESPLPRSESSAKKSQPDDSLNSLESDPGELHVDTVASLDAVHEKLDVLSLDQEPDISVSEIEEANKKSEIEIFEDDEDDEDNKSVVSATFSTVRKHSLDALSQIAALKMGLERLQHEMDSGCPTPKSPEGF